MSVPLAGGRLLSSDSYDIKMPTDNTGIVTQSRERGGIKREREKKQFCHSPHVTLKVTMYPARKQS